MPRRALRRGHERIVRSERGFTLLETAIAIALVCSVVLGASAAVVRATHANADFAERAALSNDARNVLSDLRVATAYDGAALRRLGSRTYTSQIVRDGVPLTVAVAIRPSGASAPSVASVTVSDARGESATEERPLYDEAPAPGSIVDQTSPSPAIAP
jgi:prepilin-type N-terminal cleavage/methylation domain-containing protein